MRCSNPGCGNARTEDCALIFCMPGENRRRKIVYRVILFTKIEFLSVKIS
jgi:hypothetical protein